jgi:hypothetical protein
MPFETGIHWLADVRSWVGRDQSWIQCAHFITVSQLHFDLTPQRSHGNNGFTFVVTLSRLNKKNSEKEIIRMEAHPPYYRPTAIEARHWGATYALYRVRSEEFDSPYAPFIIRWFLNLTSI